MYLYVMMKKKLIVAPMVVDFNDDKDEEETISVDDIEIVIE